MKKGISIISLIITIVVIIILTTTLVFSGFNSPNNANFAKFTSHIQNIQSAIHDEFLRRKTNHSLSEEHKENSHIYYSIATGLDVDLNTNLDELAETIQLTDLNLDILPNGLEGTECYAVTKGIQISSKTDDKGFYTDFDTIEKHYITDEGEFFILPGYPYNNGGITKWYITSSKYYESSEPIQAVFSLSSNKRIVFDAKGGTVSERIRIRNEGEILGDLPTPKKAGYLFDGWYTQPESGEKITPDIIMENKGFTCYAHWIQAVAEVNGIPCLTFTDVIKSIPKNKSETVVKLYSDIQENLTIDKNQNIIFDLQGHTLNNNGNFAVITNNGNISMTNGTINTTSVSHAAINNNSTGTFKIISGSIISNGNRQAIHNDGGKVEIGGTAYLSANSNERATVTNVNGGTLTITGGTIIATKLQAVSNAGTMIIGKKDGQISIDSPIIQGKTYGITATSNFFFYDGTIKGMTKAIDNESKIQEIEKNAFLKHDHTTVDDLSYMTVFTSFDPKEYDTIYENLDDYVFDGTNFEKVDINLFSKENIHKDFSISFIIKNYTLTNQSQPTIINIKDESGSPYNGIAYRLAEKTAGLQFSPKGCATPINHKALGNITENLKVLIERKDNIIYLWQDDELCSECDYSKFNSFFNVPITIGSSYKNGNAFRFFKGTLSNIVVKVEK